MNFVRRVISFIALLFIIPYVSFHWLTSVYYIAENLFSSPCIIRPNKFILQFMRKPLDCSVCVNSSLVDTVTEISQNEFEAKYAYSGRPIVIRGAAKNWKAMDTFNYEFFKRLNELTQMNSCQFITYDNQFDNLNDLFLMDPARAHPGTNVEPWYIGWSVCDPLAVSMLREYYEKPYFLARTSENHIVDWIFMGTAGYGAKLHVDDVRLPSWQAQIKGRKRWILRTPTECLYTCEESFSVDMWPGDIIVLDTNLWYHATEVISEEISITVGAEFD